ncbi:hypothetical protein ZWY2020_041282 [Hordeum vulgare]|nr:hypothetical protein ZWY2020_041282 [Hordeum vulgare]
MGTANPAVPHGKPRAEATRGRATVGLKLLSEPQASPKDRATAPSSSFHSLAACRVQPSQLSSPSLLASETLARGLPWRPSSGPEQHRQGLLPFGPMKEPMEKLLLGEEGDDAVQFRLAAPTMLVPC